MTSKDHSVRALLHIIEAVEILGDNAERVIIADASGYSIEKTGDALNRLADLHMAYRPFNCLWRLTEQGKITLAVHKGRQQKRRFPPP